MAIAETAEQTVVDSAEPTVQTGSTVDPSEEIEKLIREGAYRAAAARCAQLHGASIGRLCMAMLGSQTDAEEGVQDTLLAAYGAMASYRGDGSVRAWLYGIARKVCARRLETQKQHEVRLRLVPHPDAQPQPAAPDAQLETQRRAQRVRQVLQQLKPSERETLLLRYEAELSYREVALACGIDEAAARQRAGRALDRLRGLLTEKEEGTP